MSIEAVKAALPEYARDLKLNLSSVLGETPGISAQQQWGTAVACAIACRSAELRNAIVAEAETKLTPEALNAAKTAAALMGMNNIYYRFTHLVGNDEYEKMPARLRMNAMAKPGIDKADFELLCLAVSAVNGCGRCVESHEKVLAGHGMLKETIQNAVRIAAVIHGVAAVLEDEARAQPAVDAAAA